LVLSGVGVSAGCGGERPPRPEQEASGVDLVAGQALDRSGLLVVPREGGRAVLRSLRDPDITVWTGRTELPASVAVHPAGRTVLLVEEEGQVHRYDPARDQLHALGVVAPDARWIPTGEGGAFVGSHGVLAVTETDARSLELDRPPLWAAPAAGGSVVGLVAAEGGERVVLWPADTSEPESTGSIGVRRPALVTGWGGTLVGASEDGELVALDLPGLETVHEGAVEGGIAALAASPSSHRVYVATADDDEVFAVDRFGWDARELDDLDDAIEAIRPSVIGDYLLVRTAGAVWVLDLDDGAAPVPIEWGEEMPIGLPGGRVLGMRDGRLVIASTDAARQPVAVEGPAGAWWVPVEWGPGGAVDRVATADGEPAEVAGGPQDVGRSVGLGTSSRPIGAADEVPVAAPPSPGRPADAMPGAGDPVPPGYYAVAASSRQLAGVRSLGQALERSGYPSRVLARRDEADDLWYRLMLGPYRTRGDAEEVVRRLRSERGIRAWIREVTGRGAGTGAGTP
ncbi:MAG: SPOR domain-containing protein, partial [Gemmatimonadota bacterium]